MMLPEIAETVPLTTAGLPKWNGSAAGAPGAGPRRGAICAFAIVATRSRARARRLVIIPSFYDHHVDERCDLRRHGLVIADHDDRAVVRVEVLRGGALDVRDRTSTRLNSSDGYIPEAGC